MNIYGDIESVHKSNLNSKNLEYSQAEFIKNLKE